MHANALMTSPHRYKVLIVDDEQAITEMLAHLLDDENLAVTTAASGFETIARLLDVPQGAIPSDLESLKSFIHSLPPNTATDFDLLIIDIKMPGMDGFETVEFVRCFAPELPVIMMTAYGIGQFRDKIEVCGIEKVLRKPFEIEDFHNSVLKTLEKFN